MRSRFIQLDERVFKGLSKQFFQNKPIYFIDSLKDHRIILN
jgi:hypothetical protein